jgi:small redox-active disulfide protein 2
MSEEITHVRIADFSVGLIGLKGIFKEINQSGLKDQALIKEKLIERIQEKNYIPDSAREEYVKALWREYRKSLGEIVEDDSMSVLAIRVLGPGCPACEQMMEDVRTILAELNLPADLQHVRSPDEIAQFGLIATPALVINNKIKISGRKAPRDQLWKWLASTNINQAKK